MRRVLTALVVLALLASSRLEAATYYVSTSGSAGGTGAPGNPWDLRTAFAGAGGVIVGDDVVYLTAGTYAGHFYVTAAGSSGHPVTFAAQPGATVTIDGSLTTTITSGIASGGGDFSSISFTVASAVDLIAGQIMAVDADTANGEYVNITSIVGSTVTGLRNRNGSSCCPAHSIGARAWPVPAAIITLEAVSHDVTFSGFSIVDSAVDSRILSAWWDTDPTGGGSGGAVRRRNCFSTRAARVTVTDIVMHDCGEGLDAWAQATDFVAKDIIIFNNGMIGSGRGYGHAIYTQNTTGAKLFENVIAGNNYATQGKMGGSGASFTNNYTWNRMVTFGSHLPALDGIDVPPLFGLEGAGDNIAISNSHFYNGASFGYSGGSDLTHVVVSSSTFRQSVLTHHLKSVTFAGNAFIPDATQGYPGDVALTLIFDQATPAVSDYTFTANAYYRAQNAYPYNQWLINPDPNDVSNTCQRYWWNAGAQGYGYCATPSSWQGLGYDAGGSYSTTAPTGSTAAAWAFSTVGTKYALVVYNWDAAASVSVNVSGLGLPNGQVVTLRNVADYVADAVVLTVSGGALAVPMTGHTIAVPLGAGAAVGSSTFPAFGAFVVALGGTAPGAGAAIMRGPAALRNGAIR